MAEEQAEALTKVALGRSGLADMRPAYRRLLVRLKQKDPTAFEEASRRYREEYEPAIAGGDVDPIASWLEYGTWLAGQLSDGRVLAIDASGRAHPFDPTSSAAYDSAAGAMVLHLPDDDRIPATLLAIPSSPSDPQKETADLLVR